MALKWYGDQVLAQVQIAKNNIISEAAFQIESEAKVNLTENNQVDVGFLRNAVYAVTPNGDHYSQTDPTGEYYSKKQERMVKRRRAAKINLPSGTDAAVVAGTDYAIHQETRKSFFY